MLPAESRTRLETLLSGHERATTNQVVVAIFPSLQGEEVDDWVNRVFRAWDLGQKGRNNGVLLAIFVEERKARIEVGYGLEDRLTDVRSSRILRERLFPALQRGDWAGGVEDATGAIVAALGGEAAPPPRRRGNPVPPWVGMLVLLLALALFRTLARGQVRSYGRRGRRGGVIVGPWWWGGGGFGGGSSAGGFGGGGFGGGGFGGGGFSGGGGSSGGGGASGSW